MHAACVVLSAARVLLFGVDPFGDALVLASCLLATTGCSALCSTL